MWSTRSLVWARPTAQEQEWADAELVEQVELLEALAGMILSPRTVRLLQEGEAAPIAWGRLALLAGFVLAGWAVFASLVYIGFTFAS
ncbi:MAG TPA: hypothetical protein VNB88_11755 [Gaiellaceae bacterium]|jgi:hypothetical protein|nr:hypothetical protein [Gaiellaceae bacterium]